MKAPTPQVLAVKHDAVNALDVKEMLRDMGAETTIVSTGEQAMTTMQQQRFDLVLLSIHLPGISGIEVCRRIKQEPKLQAIPVIFLSGETGPHFVDLAFQAGAADFLRKPYEPADFKARVLVHLPTPGGGDEVAARGQPVHEP